MMLARNAARCKPLCGRPYYSRSAPMLIAAIIIHSVPPAFRCWDIQLSQTGKITGAYHLWPLRWERKRWENEKSTVTWCVSSVTHDTCRPVHLSLKRHYCIGGLSGSRWTDAHLCAAIATPPKLQSRNLPACTSNSCSTPWPHATNTALFIHPRLPSPRPTTLRHNWHNACPSRQLTNVSLPGWMLTFKASPSQSLNGFNSLLAPLELHSLLWDSYVFL